MGATVRINGVTISGSQSVSINNGVLTVEGKPVDTKDAKDIKIEINGDIKNLSADVVNSIVVKGNADTVKTLSGDIDIEGNVDGNVNSMSGDIKVGGSVTGSVSTMSGDIRHK